MKDPHIPGRRKRARGKVHMAGPVKAPEEPGVYFSACKRVLRDPPRTLDPNDVTCPHCLKVLGEEVELRLLKETVHASAMLTGGPADSPLCGVEKGKVSFEHQKVTCASCLNVGGEHIP